MIARVALYVAASWLIAAHFLRVGNLVAAALCLATPLLFLLRRPWVPWVLEGLAYAVSVTWLVTTWQIVVMRQAFGAPWLRAAAILLAVAAVTALAGALLRGPVPRARYRGR